MDNIIQNKFKREFSYRNSVRFRIIGITVGITIVIVCLAWVISRFMLEDFYVINAKKTLEETFTSCNEYVASLDKDDLLEDEGIGDFYGNVKNGGNALICIVNREDDKIYSSAYVNKKMEMSIRMIIYSNDFDAIEKSDMKYIMKLSTNKDNALDFDSDGLVDTEVGSTLDLIGVLDNGDLIIIRRNFETLSNSMKFAARFFTIATFALILLETFVLLLFTHRFTSPIIEMSQVADRMTRLDFDAKVNVKSKDEIGRLGENINKLSTTLESSISKLKSANLELKKDIEEKEKIESMRSEFLSHVSHELKTPIALIQGYAEGLQEGTCDDPESMKYYVDVIIDEAEKMNTLVMKLLDLNELEYGKTLNIERFNITDLINDVISANKLPMEQKSINFSFDEDDIIPVWADEFMIEEVFTNYLGNAIHYAKQGGKVRVWYEQRDKSVRINVFDEGDRIADKDIDKVFIKFYKADEARTRSYGGSGIGLSIVEAIMKSHKQDYGVYNVDNGVVFYFELDTRGDMVDKETL